MPRTVTGASSVTFITTATSGPAVRATTTAVSQWRSRAVPRPRTDSLSPWISPGGSHRSGAGTTTARAGPDPSPSAMSRRSSIAEDVAFAAP